MAQGQGRGPKRRWSAEEDQALRDGARELPDRSWTAVNARRQKLGLSVSRAEPFRPWTDEEVAFIVDNRLTMQQDEMGEKLGRSRTAVSQKLIQLGLVGDRSQADWARRGDGHHGWKGGKEGNSGFYGRHWERFIRAQVFARDEWGCVICFSPRIICHHIVPYRETQDHSVQNQVSLCQPHHMWVESYLDRSVMQECVRSGDFTAVRSAWLCTNQGAVWTPKLGKRSTSRQEAASA